jgi:hypothetical protein
MRKRTFPAVATSVIISTAAMMAVPAVASALGAATSISPPVTGATVQQVSWDGPYGQRPYFHHRFFHEAFVFHHRFHGFHRW